jgi:hypothetical protein
MRLFNTRKNNDQLVRLLQKSRTGFDFDKKGVRVRLMSNIEEQQLTSATERVRELRRKSFLSRHRLATALGSAILVAAGSGAALSRANISGPGDKLHSFDQFQEQALLKLPLPQSQKASIQAGMVAERNRELNYILEVEDQNHVKVQAVKESQAALNQAVEQARAAKENYAKRGKQSNELKLNGILNRLEGLAQEQEDRVGKLREMEENELVQKELDNQIEEIKKARVRAHVELN